MGNRFQERENGEIHKRLCDFCGENKALLYCRADSAKLCFGCDREVHSTNQLFKKHTRCLLCDVCDSSPASIFCCTDASVFCQNCDWEAHNSVRSVHDRRPMEGFSGCPSVTELLGLLGFDDLDKKKLFFGYGDENQINEGYEDFLVWETPSITSLDDLIGSNDSGAAEGPNFQAMGVPPLPKNRNATCGQHKEEILWQLHEMAKAEPDFSGCLEDLEPHFDMNSLVQGENHHVVETEPGLVTKAEPTTVPSFEGNAFGWSAEAVGTEHQGYDSALLGSFIDSDHLVPTKHSDGGENSGHINGGQEGQAHVPLNTGTIPALPKVAARELNAQERDSAISRYKEKRKTRRYDKHIRYESRKVRAESRTRIKGRFAKINRPDTSTLG